MSAVLGEAVIGRAVLGGGYISALREIVPALTLYLD